MASPLLTGPQILDLYDDFIGSPSPIPHCYPKVIFKVRTYPGKSSHDFIILINDTPELHIAKTTRKKEKEERQTHYYLKKKNNNNNNN